jgi:sugar phosphate isomerase/epimerase
MRLAFSTLACPEWTLDRIVRAASDYGYEGVELRVLDGELLTPSLPADRRGHVRSTLQHAELALCCVDTSYEIANPDHDLSEALAYVELAADLGGPMIRLFAGAPRREAAAKTARRTIDRLARLADVGRGLGVSIGVETHDSFATGAAMFAMLRDAPPDVGVIWDTLNSLVAGEAPETTFPLVASRLVHVHVKDGGLPPDPERNLLFGEGRVPLVSILRTLSANAYDGWLSVEWEKLWQPSIPGPEIALPRYAQALRETLTSL